MCYILILVAFLTTRDCFSQIQTDIEGYYDLVSKTQKKNGEVYGYTGSLQIKRIAKNKHVIVIYACKGAPSYNSGVLIDTVEYNTDNIICTCTCDSSCKIQIRFKGNKAFVEHNAGDYNFSCGFGHGVVATGTYKKSGKAVRKLIDPQSGEEIK